MRYLLPVAAMLSSAVSKTLNIGVFSDVHLALNYSPVFGSCTSGSIDSPKGLFEKLQKLSDDQLALLGRLGCDPPQELVDYMLHLFNQVN